MKHLSRPKRCRGICAVVVMLTLLLSQWSIPTYPVSAGPLPTAGSVAANTIIFVDIDAIGANNGTSWTHAFTDLQSALSAANPVGADTVEIWVAEGIYKPTGGVTRTLSFQLKHNVSLYGGFAGTEADRSQRNIAAHPTVLSGDLLGNDTNNVDPFDTSRTDNSYHVVTDAGGTAVSTLDGFIITAGNANDSLVGDLKNGGGMFTTGEGTVLKNIIFKHNTAANNGAGLYNTGTPMLLNVTFLGNRAIYNGGGMYSTSNNAVGLTNMAFLGNVASNGAGLYANGTVHTLINAVFSGNRTDFDGGGIANNVDLLTLINVTFSGNTAISTVNSQGGGLANYGGNAVVIANSIFWDNQAPVSPMIYNEGTVTVTYSLTQGGIYTGTGNISTDPLFADADGGDNIRGTIDDDLRLRNTSPAIDAGDNDAVPAGITTDLAGAPRFVNHPNADTGHGTPPIVDMGAYEKGTSNQAPYTPNNPRPAHEATNVSPKALLSWSGGDPDGDSVTYTVAFGTSSAPPDVVTTGTASYNPGTLNAETTYYWRITATDGVSTTVGSVWSFTTASSALGSCIRYPSTDTPMPLVYGTVNSILTVPDIFTVGDVNVTLNINHTYVSDLVITLFSPDGGQVILVNQAGGAGYNFIDTVLDDEAATDIGTGTAPFTGRYRPYQALSFMDGKAASGAWRLAVSDLAPSDTGTLLNWQLELCSMTPGNHAPHIPAVPSPANGATNVPTGATLSWLGGDPDGDVVTYTVAFGTSSPPPIVNAVTSTSYNPGPLVYGVTYRWQITATDGLSTTVGPIWSFTTASGPTVNGAPYVPYNPTPPDGAIGVANSAKLAWSGGDPDGDFVTYTVAFGTVSPPPVVNTAVTTANYNPGVLVYDLTYYWQITATDGISMTGGPLWSFTTGAPPGDFGKISPPDTATDISVSPTLSWGASSGADSYAYCYGTTDAVCPGDVWTSTTEITAVLSGLNDGTIYYWQVRAVNTAGTTEADGEAWWSFTTANVNDAPLFTSKPVTTAVETTPYTYTVIVDDPDLIWGDVLTITAPTRPVWLMLTKQGDVTATLTGTPPDGSMGDYAVVLQVADSEGLTETQAFTITVAYFNDAPFFTSTPVTAATQNVLYTYPVTADDPDLALGDALTITAPTRPAWLTLADHGDGTATLSGTPPDTAVGDHAVVLRVTDRGGMQATQTFTITVANVNDAPFFTSMPVTTAKPGALYTYTVTTDDPDLTWGDVLTITAPTCPAWLTLTDHGDGTALLTGTPSAADGGEHAVQLRVTDSAGLMATQTFMITVSYQIYLPLVLRNAP